MLEQPEITAKAVIGFHSSRPFWVQAFGGAWRCDVTLEVLLATVAKSSQKPGDEERVPSYVSNHQLRTVHQIFSTLEELLTLDDVGILGSAMQIV